MKKVLTLGEVMLRLKSPGHERLLQSPVLEATFGGGEANVAVSLANYGMPTGLVSVLPDNAIADACLRELRGLGVDTAWVLRQGQRMGIYYLETGSNQRPSKVIYDREHSAIAEANTKDFDWPSVFADASWLHITGITPAISVSAAELSLSALQEAKAAGLKVSCDLNYRKNLWKYGKTARDVMKTLMPFVDVVIANEEDFQMSLGIQPALPDIETGSLNPKHYEAIARAAKEQFPNITTIAVTLRRSHSADRNDWQACLLVGDNFYLSRSYLLTDIVDRIGGGDSFSAGLIFGLINKYKPQDALEFAVAASCLKHTIPGDYNQVSKTEVDALLTGGGSGRIQR